MNATMRPYTRLRCRVATRYQVSGLNRYLTHYIQSHAFLLDVAETSEDISPYATFQLSEASTLVQPPHHAGPANTLLHSFMYHERALQEGCASPPPPAVLREYAQNSLPYYNIVGFP